MENSKSQLNELMLQASPDIFLFLNTNFEIKFANRACEEILGIKRDELLKQNIETLMPNDYHKAFNDRIELIKTEGSSEIDIELRDSDGDSVPFWCRLRALFDSNGIIDGYILVFRDMHERKMIEDNLVEKYQISKSKLIEKDQEIQRLNKKLGKEIIARERYRNTINALQRRMNLEYDIVQLSKEFFQDSEPDNSMIKIFDVIGNTICADFAFIYSYKEETGDFRLRNIWEKKDLEEKPFLQSSIKAEGNRWLFERLQKDSKIYIYDKNELQEQYERKLGFLFGEFHSLILVALKFENKLLGFYGFQAKNLGFNFIFDDSALLELVGNLFISADIFDIGTGNNLSSSFTVQRILDISNDYSLVIDHQGKIIHIGPHFRHRLGYKYLDIINRKLVDFCPESFETVTTIKKNAKNKSSVINLSLKNSDGKNIDFRMNISFGKFKKTHAIFLLGKEVDCLNIQHSKSIVIDNSIKHNPYRATN
ncbi:MAG: PAS domain S-box protein [Candidatus Zixiibacteriota bacterium]